MIDSIARKKLYQTPDMSECCSKDSEEKGTKSEPVNRFKKNQSMSTLLEKFGKISGERRMSHDIKFGMFREYSSMVSNDALNQNLNRSKIQDNTYANSIIEDEYSDESSGEEKEISSLSTPKMIRHQSYSAHMVGTDSLTFDIFKFSEKVGRENTLTSLAVHCSASLNLFDSLKIDKEIFTNFMNKIYDGYRRDVEYHNDLHGADVMQFCYVVMKKSKLVKAADLNDLDVFSALVAAACHDFGHDGYTNQYHVNTISDRAIMCNDVAVQENYHAAEAFKILN